MNRKSEGTQETEERGAKQRGPCSLVFFPWRFHVLSCQTGRLSVTGGGCRSIRIAVDGLLRNGGAPNARRFPLCVGSDPGDRRPGGRSFGLSGVDGVCGSLAAGHR